MNSNSQIDSFSVIGNGGRVAVEVLGYENSQPQNVSDANWLRARIQLDIGECVLRVAAALTTQDIQYFLDELHNLLLTLDGSATLTTDEETITLRVKFTRTGTVRLSGTLKEFGVTQIKVDFEFESDQSFLQRTLSELKDIQRKYPPVVA